MESQSTREVVGRVGEKKGKLTGVILENHLASDRNDVGRVHSHCGESKDGVNSDDGCEYEKSHESCEMMIVRNTLFPSV